MAYDGPPIHYAVRGGDTALALRRIQDGADVDFYKPGDGNAVLWAAFTDNFEVLRALVERGAKLNVVHDQEGKSALDYCGEARCYKLLKDHGAIHVKGEPRTWANYDLDALLKLPPAEALRHLDSLVRGVLRSAGEETLYQISELLSTSAAIVEEARQGSPQEAVSSRTVFWGNLDFQLTHLVAVGDTETGHLIGQILKVFGPEYKFFEAIDSERVDLIDEPSATEIARLLRRILEGRTRLEELQVHYIAAHRELFEKP